jgi:hypothetical protein
MAESGEEDLAGWDEACRREAAIRDLLNRYPKRLRFDDFLRHSSPASDGPASCCCPERQRYSHILPHTLGCSDQMSHFKQQKRTVQALFSVQRTARQGPLGRNRSLVSGRTKARRFDPRLPFTREIVAYQKHQVKRLRIQRQ